MKKFNPFFTMIMKTKKRLPKLLMFILFVGLLSACASEPKENPEAVIEKFKTAMTQIESGDLALTLLMQGADAQDKVDFKGDLSLQFDRQEELAPKTEVGANLEGTLQAASRSLTGTLGFSARIIGNEFFVKLEKLDSTDPSLLTLKPLIAAYQGKWLRLAEELLPETLKNFQAKDAAALAREKELKELFRESRLFRVTQEYGIETVNRKKAYHYGVELDQKGIEEYLQASLAITGGMVNEAKIADAGRLTQAVKEAELWIGADDYFLYRGKLVLSPNSEKDASVNLLVDLDLTAKSYNETLKIKAPENPEEFNPLALLMGGAAAPANAEANPEDNNE